MEELTHLSVVVLNYNSYGDTVTCVNNLIQFHNGMHIIIVDNCSPDGSYVCLKNKYSGVENIFVIQSDKNGGYSYGNNFGIRYAVNQFNSQVVGILNPDIILTDPSVLTTMCEALKKHPKLAVVGASTLDSSKNYNPNNSGWNVPTGFELVRWHFLRNDRKRRKINWKKLDDNLAQVGCVAGCFFLAKTDVLKELGYLDENVFMFHEENILGIKCRKKGYLEGVVLNKYYIHNHKQIKGEKVPFKKKINATAIVYQSAKYVLKKYYSRVYLPVLFVVELMNKCFLTIAYFKNLFNNYSN